MQMVSDAFMAMKTEQLDKVVLSRLLEIETSQPVDRPALMARVIAQKPHGFHFHVPLEWGRYCVPALSCCCANPTDASIPTPWLALPGVWPMLNVT